MGGNEFTHPSSTIRPIMKFATYQDGSRDGQLVVVSRDLSSAHYASGVAQNLRELLDDWNFLSPMAQDLYETLNHGKARHAFPFESARCLAPLPRPPGFVQGRVLDGSEHQWTGGGEWRGACSRVPDVTQGVLEAGLAAITADLPAACGGPRAAEALRLFMPVVHWRRESAPFDPEAQAVRAAYPLTLAGPVAVTPDEWGEAWSGSTLAAAPACALECRINGRRWPEARASAGAEPRPFHWGRWVARAAASQSLLAGTVVSAATLALPVLAATDQVSLEWRAGELGGLLGALTPGARSADQNSTS